MSLSGPKSAGRISYLFNAVKSMGVAITQFIYRVKAKVHCVLNLMHNIVPIVKQIQLNGLLFFSESCFEHIAEVKVLLHNNLLVMPPFRGAG
mgnify:CR=1 FL=1